MRQTIALMGAVLAIAGGPGCQGNTQNCYLNPVLDCFVGKSGGAGPTTNGGNAGAGGAECVGMQPADEECRSWVCAGGTWNPTDLGDGTPCGSNGQLTCKSGACGGCMMDGDCASGHCADGVCCNEDCDGPCMACTAELTGQPEGKDGLCEMVLVGSPDPNLGICDSKGGCGETKGWCRCADGVKNGDETDVDCGGSCGSSCTIGQACGTNQDCNGGGVCKDGVCCNSACDAECAECSDPEASGLCIATLRPSIACEPQSVCNGDFQCRLGAGQPCSSDIECATRLCNALVCEECSTDSDCGGPLMCVQGVCLMGSLPLGERCTHDSQCNTSLCRDTSCCESPCSGQCMACQVNYTGAPSGTCAPILVGYDPQGECSGPGAAATCDGNGNCGTNPQ